MRRLAIATGLGALAWRNRERVLALVRRGRRTAAAPKEYDDVTLAHKVETELFRDADVPKGQINVNAQDGVVQLRGEIPDQEMIDDLVERTRNIQGVRDVENLLHPPGVEAPMHQ
jgi:osmotically-inducible protein OsmY